MRQKEEIQAEFVTTSEEIGKAFKALGEHYINRGNFIIDNASTSYEDTNVERNNVIDEMNFATEKLGLAIAQTSQKLTLLTRELSRLDGTKHVCDSCGREH